MRRACLTDRVGWDAEAVDAAFTDWLWVPPGTQVHELPGARLLIRPAWLSHRTFTVGTPPAGREDEAIEMALSLVREAGLPSVRWALGERPDNADFAELADLCEALAWYQVGTRAEDSRVTDLISQARLMAAEWRARNPVRHVAHAPGLRAA